MNKRNRVQHMSLSSKHKKESWKSGGGCKDSFLKFRTHKRNTGTRRTQRVGRQSQCKKEKLEPFGQNTGKKQVSEAQDITRHSGEVWLRVGTSGNKNDEERTSGRHST